MYHHPSEEEGAKTDSNSDNEEAIESITAPIDPLAQLQAEIKEAKAEVAEWQDRFLRKAAEFENYRKRTEKEKTDAMLLANSSVLMEFLPVADACDRALSILDNSKSAAGEIQQYREGVELLYRQMLDALGRTGTTAMETKGKAFDPHLHEALSREETTDFEEGTVIKELRRGYLFKDKLLRPAQVIVAINPHPKDPTSK